MGCLLGLAYFVDVTLGMIFAWQHNIYVPCMVILTFALLLIVEFNIERRIGDNG